MHVPETVYPLIVVSAAFYRDIYRATQNLVPAFNFSSWLADLFLTCCWPLLTRCIFLIDNSERAVQSKASGRIVQAGGAGESRGDAVEAEKQAWFCHSYRKSSCCPCAYFALLFPATPRLSMSGNALRSSHAC